MNPVLEDRYVVFVRMNGEREEQPLASCATYEEARILRRRLNQQPGEFVIRYVGQTGGGD